MHDVFSEPHRRHVLYRLNETAGPVPISTLVDDVRHDGEPVVSQKAVERWLLHEHVLPLDRFGLVDYDPTTDTVELSDEVVITVAAPRSADLDLAVDESEGA